MNYKVQLTDKAKQDLDDIVAQYVISTYPFDYDSIKA